MILFKACSRCGGDVDATYHDDVYCVECAYRPPFASLGLRLVDAEAGKGEKVRPPEHLRREQRPGSREKVELAAVAALCPKCNAHRAVRLDKSRPQDHTCYRCGACGHIFSPGVGDVGKSKEGALP